MAHEVLFKPIKVGPVEIKNRLALAPTNTNYSDNHLVGDQTLSWYTTLAKGGLGLLVFEATPVSSEAAETSIYNIHHFWGPEHVPGMRRLVESVHSHGAKIFIQLSPGLGIQAAKRGSGVIPKAPSRVNFRMQAENMPESILKWFAGNPNMVMELEGEMAEELTEEEIERRISAYAQACILAVNTGFDGVEIHSPHGYLVHDFLSPRYNKRTDAYGGSLENRMRFLLRIISAAKEVIESRIALGARLSIDERNEDGIHFDEMRQVAMASAKAGLDYLSVSDGCYEQAKYFAPDEDGTMLEGAMGFKDVIDVPVMTPGLHNPDHAAAAIEDGKTDIVGLSRPVIADPEWANKVQNGEADRIRRCVRCNHCIFCLFNSRAVRCTVNRQNGQERFNLNRLLK